MIQIIPELNFMHALRGVYCSDACTEHVRIWSCGYGVALDISDSKKTKFVGVIGAAGPSGAGVECFAQVGMPNVFRMTGSLTANASIEFVCDEPPFTLSLAHKSDVLHLKIAFSGVEKFAHELRRYGVTERPL